MLLHECVTNKPGIIRKKIIFDDKLNIIYGKNESGKTLIAKAIIDTVYGYTSGSYFLNGKTWNDMDFEILLSISSKKFRYLKNKKDTFCVKTNDDNFENELIRIPLNDKNSDELVNAPVTGFLKILNDKTAESHFKRINLKTFITTSYIPDPVEMIRNKSFDYSILLGLVLFDNSGFYSELKKYNDSMSLHANTFAFSMNRKENPLSTLITITENELNTINKDLEINNLHLSKTDRLAREKKRLEQDLKKFNKLLSDERNLKKITFNLQSNFTLLKENNNFIDIKLIEKADELDKIKDITDMETSLNETYPRFSSKSENDITNLKKIQETYGEVRDVYEKIENYYFKHGKKKNSIKNKVLTLNIFLVLFLSGILGINIFYPMQFIVDYMIYFIAGIVSLSFLSIIIFLIFHLSHSMSGELQEIIKNKLNVEKQFEAILKKNGIILSDYKLEAIYEYLVKYFEEYGEYSIQYSELMKMKENLNHKNYIKDIDNELNKLKTFGDEIRLKIDNDLKNFNNYKNTEINENLINQILLEKNKIIRELKENIKNTAYMISNIDREMMNNRKYDSELVNSLIDEKKKKQAVLNKLNDYKTSLNFVLDTFKEAVAAREEKKLTELIMKTGDTFNYLTDNQYSEIINSDFIKNFIYGKEIGDMNPSVVHLLLLSLKFSITDILNALDKNLPLIIDEPFQHMDEMRIQRFENIVKNESANRQIIIFTHNNRYSNWGAYTEL